MRIYYVNLQNYRTFKNADFVLFPYTVFVGKNNSGKSNLMKALNSFFSHSLTYDDFREENGQRATKMKIIITFSRLSPFEKEVLKDNLVLGKYVRVRMYAELKSKDDIDITYSIDKMVGMPRTSEEHRKLDVLFEDPKNLDRDEKILEYEKAPQELLEMRQHMLEEKKQANPRA